MFSFSVRLLYRLTFFSDAYLDSGVAVLQWHVEKAIIDILYGEQVPFEVSTFTISCRCLFSLKILVLQYLNFFSSKNVFIFLITTVLQIECINFVALHN